MQRSGHFSCFPMDSVNDCYVFLTMFRSRLLTEQADLWSVGIILYQLVTGFPPFNGDSQIQLMRNILKSGQLRFPPGCELSHDCIDLCGKLLRINSVERLTVEEFVKHPFLFEHPPERALR
jgi:serine/threonine-protein kinase ULK/ATG1